MNQPEAVVIAWSGDPITYGHIDLVKQVLEDPRCKDMRKIFAIGQNIEKRWTFSTQEKIDMIKHTLGENFADIEICFYEGLLADFMFENNAVAARWVRDQKDKDYETALDTVGKSQWAGYETWFFQAKDKLKWVSSTSVKSLQKDHGDTRDYVPLYVKQRLEAKISDQYIIGMSGSIAAGKSTIAKQFVEFGKEDGIPVHNIDRDDLAKTVYFENAPMAVKIRWELITLFGEEIRDSNASGANSILTQQLAAKYFSNMEQYKEQFTNILRPWIFHKRRKILPDKKGIIIANAALLPDSQITDIANNNIVLVGVDEKEQRERLQKRNGYSDVEIQQRLLSQDNYEVKKIKILDAINKDNHGHLWEIDNSGPDVEAMKAERQFNEMVADVDIYGELRMTALCSRIPNEIVCQSTDPKALLGSIKALYDANGRPYHNWAHIMEVWNNFWKIKHMFSEDSVDKIQWAILFHDIVYKTTGVRREKRRNEEESWLVAKKFLEQLGFDAVYTWDIKEYIMNTKHRDEPIKKDGKLLKDLDMQILASEPERYQEYSQQIREEWGQFNDDVYKIGRQAFLQWVTSKQIFLELIQYEDRARQNIAAELAALKTS